MDKISRRVKEKIALQKASYKRKKMLNTTKNIAKKLRN
jgi:hypothetical protein